jgi:hypothetical protein
MRTLTVAAAVAVIAVSLASFVSYGPPPSTPLASVSPYDLTLAAPAMPAGPAADAF